MTLLIAIILIVGFNLNSTWYLYAIATWILHLAWHSDSNKVSRMAREVSMINKKLKIILDCLEIISMNQGRRP